MGAGSVGVIAVYTLSPWTAGTSKVAAGTPGSGMGSGGAGTAGAVLNVVID